MIAWILFGNGIVSFVTFSWALLLDTVTNLFCCFVLAGIFGQSKMGKAFQAKEAKESQQTVESMAGRSMTVQQLLGFCVSYLHVEMLDYDPNVTTTRDVVRSVIIPMTRPDGVSEESSSYAAKYGSTKLPEKMVTHNWTNLFDDLVAAVVADALGEKTYDAIAKELQTPAGRQQLSIDSDDLHEGMFLCTFSRFCQHLHSCVFCLFSPSSCFQTLNSFFYLLKTFISSFLISLQSFLF
jgi:hypothetical protein